MKLTLLVNYDPAAALALHYLESRLTQHELCVFYTQKQSSSLKPLALTQLANFEASCLAQNSSIFERLSATRLDHINTSDFERFADSQPDLVLSIRHMSILQDATIAQAKHGVINLHSGILPDYRGVMATFWAMQNQAIESGTSLHWIDSNKIDQGAIITQTRQAINYTRSYFWNTCNLYAAACQAMAQAVSDIANLTAPNATPQRTGGHYYTYPDQRTLDTFAYELWEAHDSLHEWIRPIS